MKIVQTNANIPKQKDYNSLDMLGQCWTALLWVFSQNGAEVESKHLVVVTVYKNCLGIFYPLTNATVTLMREIFFLL